MWCNTNYKTAIDEQPLMVLLSVMHSGRFFHTHKVGVLFKQRMRKHVMRVREANYSKV